jgi:hypothetical protein
MGEEMASTAIRVQIVLKYRDNMPWSPLHRFDVQLDKIPPMLQASRGLFGRVGVSRVEIDTDGGRVD